MAELCNPAAAVARASAAVKLPVICDLDIAAPSSRRERLRPAGRHSMNDEARGPGGLDSAHDWRPRRRSPWGRRPPYPRSDGGPKGPPTYAALDLGTNNCRLLVA